MPCWLQDNHGIRHLSVGSCQATLSLTFSGCYSPVRRRNLIFSVQLPATLRWYLWPWGQILVVGWLVPRLEIWCQPDPPLHMCCSRLRLVKGTKHTHNSHKKEWACHGPGLALGAFRHTSTDWR